MHKKNNRKKCSELKNRIIGKKKSSGLNLPKDVGDYHLNRLYAIDAYNYASYNFQLVMSLPAMSLGLRFCANRKGGTGGGGRFQPSSQVTWLLLGLALGQHWVGHFFPPLHKWA